MKFNIFSWLSAIALSFIHGSISLPIIAQVTPDGTTSTTLTPTDTGVQIENGERNGDNLFHSFDEFSVPTNTEAHFNNANDVVNIFSRVTGGNISNIDGILRANGAANLFLINPAGILLGENARLQLGGSFYGSTADSILFPDGEFSATDLDNPPLITINAPIGLGFRDNPNNITVRGEGNGDRTSESEVIDTQEALRVDSNATIGLIGGELSFEGATIKTAGGSIEIGSVAGGTVDLVAVANGYTFDYSGVDGFQDISLSAQSNVDASGLGAGNIRVRGSNITLTEKSTIEANTLGDISGGSVAVFATEALTITGNEANPEISTAIAAQVFSTGSGDGGNLTMEAENLNINGFNALISTGTSGAGNAGDITLDVQDKTILEGTNIVIDSGVRDEAIGNAGKIDLTTSSLTLENTAILSTISSGNGNAGDVVVNARDNISFNGRGNTNGIFSSNINNSTGRSGDIELNTNSLTLSNGSIITNISVGRVGDISIDATENISLTNNSVISATGADEGSVTIKGQNLELITGSEISAGIGVNSGSEKAQAGDIIINLTEDLTINSINGDRVSNILNANFGTGNAGNIAINAHNISLFNGGQIANRSSGQGNLGNITLSATGNIIADGTNNILVNDENGTIYSAVTQFVIEKATGDLGSINIQAQNLTLTNGGQISSLVEGTADSGDINVSVADTIIIDGFSEGIFNDTTGFVSSEISSNVGGSGKGNSGNTNITTSNLFLSRNGNVSNTIFGEGNAGNINIIANAITIGKQGNINLLPSNITSQTNSANNSPVKQANAGNISINTNSLSIEDGGGVSVDIDSIGIGGKIKITATDSITIDGTGIVGDRANFPSAISASVFQDRLANGGEIEINTGNLSLSNNGQIDTSSSGEGNAGNINLNVTNTFSANNFGFVSSNIGNSRGASAIGKVGNVSIAARKISLNNSQIQAVIRSNATAQGTGTITLSATESISLSNDSSLLSRNDFASLGNASNVQLSAPEINIKESFVDADNRGEGKGGNINIETNNLTLNNKSNISASVLRNAIGNGGDITVNTANLTLQEGSQISATTFSAGNAGSININAAESINISGTQEQTRGGLFANALIGDGKGGDIFVSTGKLTVDDGAIITVSNFSSFDATTDSGTGEAGSLRIEANSVTLSNEARIDTATQSGNGGNITFEIADTLTLRENSFISARALNEANGGNVTINTDFIIAFPSRFDGNDIRADAEQGEGGRINITAESVFGIAESKTLNPLTNDINASSQVSGLEGTILINTPDVNALRGSSELPSNPISTNTLARTNACSVSSIGETSNLIVKGKGGILPEIINPLTADNLIIDRSTVSLNSIHNNRAKKDREPVANTPDDATKPAIETKKTGKLMAARGIIKQEDGTVYLTAYPTSNTARTTNSVLSDCTFDVN